MKLGSPFRPRLLSAFLISIFLGSAPATLAQERGELRIATSYKLMTLDPQYANLNENTSLLSHIYERLAARRGRPRASFVLHRSRYRAPDHLRQSRQQPVAGDCVAPILRRKSRHDPTP